MMSFWIAALALALLAGVAILWPLLIKSTAGSTDRAGVNVAIYRERRAELDQQLANGDLDAEAHRAMLAEAEATLLDDAAGEPAARSGTSAASVWVLLMAAVLLPLVAGAWYWQRGASQDLQLRELMQTMDSPAQAEQAVALLRDNLARDPENTQNWFMLARLYMELGHFADATMAYLEVVNREPEAANVVAEMAQALFLASNNQMTPEVQKIVARALQLDPANSTALGLAGIDAFEQQRYRQAIEFWQKAQASAGPGSPGHEALAGGIARARAALAEAGEVLPESPVAAGAAVELSLTLAEDVVGRGKTLFVYVRNPGSRMPLAVRKLKGDQIPALIRLDDSLAMVPGTRLAEAGELEVVVRLSASGEPVPRSGDWQVISQPLSLKEGSVQLALTLAEQLP